MIVDRIFLDANILFSAAYGSPGLNRLLKFAHQKRCLLFASHFVVEEAKRNLSHLEQSKRLENALSEVRIVPEADPTLPCPIELLEKDRPVLMAAISNKADHLLTGDLTHFGKYFGQTVNGLKICRPRYYLAKPLRKKK
jgi:predicted nucleic acid-binding protein